MTKFRVLAVVALMTTLLALPLGQGVAQDGGLSSSNPPSAIIHGTAIMDDGNPVPVGTMVVAMAGDDEVGSTTAMEGGGFELQLEGGRSVFFMVGNCIAYSEGLGFEVMLASGERRILTLRAAVGHEQVCRASLVSQGEDESSEPTVDPPPAPLNPTAVNGASLGEVNLTWNAVPEAAFYRVGWVAFPDYESTVAAGRNWLEAFHFFDAENAGQTQWTLTRLSPGVQYFFIIGSADERFGGAQWSEWSNALTLTSAQSMVSHGATVLVIPRPATRVCEVGLQLTPGNGCIWRHPPFDEGSDSSMVAVSDGGDYHGRAIVLWHGGGILVNPPDSDKETYSRGQRLGIRYRTQIERSSEDTWTVIGVNVPD